MPISKLHGVTVYVCCFRSKDEPQEIVETLIGAIFHQVDLKYLTWFSSELSNMFWPREFDCFKAHSVGLRFCKKMVRHVPNTTIFNFFWLAIQEITPKGHTRLGLAVLVGSCRCPAAKCNASVPWRNRKIQQRKRVRSMWSVTNWLRRHPSFQAFCSSVINEYNPAGHELPDISFLSEFGFRGFVPGRPFSTLDVFKRRRT